MYPLHDRAEGAEVPVREYLLVLRRRKWWIVGTVVLLVGLSLLRDSLTTPTYEASVQLLLRAKESESIFQPGAVQGDPDRLVENELNVIRSRQIREAASDAYGEPLSISASAGGEGDVIVIMARDSDPVEAARKANVYTEAYQRERLDAVLDSLVEARRVVQQQLDDYQAQIDEISAPLADLDAQIEDAPFGPERDRLQEERDALAESLQGEIDSATSQLNQYREELQVLQLSERLTTTGGVQILDPASVPDTPVTPRTLRNAALAGLLGLALGIGLAFLREHLDESVRTKVDLERSGNIDVLGLVPLDTQWRKREQRRFPTQTAPLSPAAEAYRSLRTALQFYLLENSARIVQVTSPTAAEGKTATVANLAVAFARAGKRVAVVGCDLRRPRIHQFLEVDGDVGLTSVLLGDVPFDEAVQVSPVDRNISVLASGPRPRNPSELLSLERTKSIIRQLLDHHTLVLLDAPPVLPVTDALVISDFADATIVVAMADQSSKRQVRRAVEMLRQVDAEIAGAVLNGVGTESTYELLYDYYGIRDRDRPPMRLFARWRSASPPDRGNGASPAAAAKDSTDEPAEAPDR